jgi:hypothetical protein
VSLVCERAQGPHYVAQSIGERFTADPDMNEAETRAKLIDPLFKDV